MTIRRTLEPRWKFGDQGKFAPLKISFNKVLDAHDSIRLKSAEIEKDAKLSAIGKVDAMRGYLASDAAPVVYRAGQLVKHAQRRLTAWRARLETPATIDKTDVAAAVLRSEYRTRFAAMKPAEKSRWLHSGTIDPVMYQAICEVPADMLGIDQTFRERMVAAWIEQKHPGAVQQIDDSVEAVALIDAALGVTTMVAARSGDLIGRGTWDAFLTQSIGDKAAAMEKDAEKFLGAFGQ